MSPDDLDRLGESMKKLRMEYDKYFMGVERMEPLKARDEVKKLLRRIMSEPTNNTARRFRMQSLQASLITYEQHWNRIVRQIEDGTFKRDRLKAQAILQGDPQSPDDAALHEADTAVGANPLAATAAARPPPAARTDEYPDSIRKLHEAFESARVQAGGESKPVPIATLAATVQKQVAAIKAQYNCKSVEFKVAIKDGKPILKAVPKI